MCLQPTCATALEHFRPPRLWATTVCRNGRPRVGGAGGGAARGDRGGAKRARGGLRHRGGDAFARAPRAAHGRRRLRRGRSQAPLWSWCRDRCCMRFGTLTSILAMRFSIEKWLRGAFWDSEVRCQRERPGALSALLGRCAGSVAPPQPRAYLRPFPLWAQVAPVCSDPAQALLEAILSSG